MPQVKRIREFADVNHRLAAKEGAEKRPGQPVAAGATNRSSRDGGERPDDSGQRIRPREAVVAWGVKETDREQRHSRSFPANPADEADVREKMLKAVIAMLHGTEQRARHELPEARGKR
eukprot:6875476-Prymnesium_polylepis.1